LETRTGATSLALAVRGFQNDIEAGRSDRRAEALARASTLRGILRYCGFHITPCDLPEAAMGLSAPALMPDERFNLVVIEPGFLPIPHRVRITLRLEPGEMVAMERWPATLYLETYSFFLGALEDAVPCDEHWNQVVKHFLCRPLTVLEGRGLPIPAALFPLETGDRLVLQVLFRGQFPELYVYPADLRGVRRDLAIEREG